MAYTFGSATSDNLTWTDSGATYAATARSNLVCGWFYPTTLTAGRCLWSVGAINRCAIATTTSEIDLFVDRTTDSQHTTSGLGLVVNEWHFIAVLGSFFNTGPVATYRVWRGVGTGIPQLVTVNQTAAGNGNSTSSTIVTVGNASSAGTVAFQGDIARFDYIAGTLDNSLVRTVNGTISGDDEKFIYNQCVIPIWQNELPRYFESGTQSNNSIQHTIAELDLLQPNFGTTWTLQTSRNGGTIQTANRSATAAGVAPSLNRAPILSFRPSRMRPLVRR